MAHTVETLQARCKKRGNCLIWTGATNGGVPVVHHNNTNLSARRLIFALYRNEHLPEAGLIVKPTCGNQKCLAKGCLQLFTGLDGKEPAKRWTFGRVRSIFDLAGAL